jgi:hypothetical protein
MIRPRTAELSGRRSRVFGYAVCDTLFLLVKNRLAPSAPKGVQNAINFVGTAISPFSVRETRLWSRPALCAKAAWVAPASARSLAIAAEIGWLKASIVEGEARTLNKIGRPGFRSKGGSILTKSHFYDIRNFMESCVRHPGICHSNAASRTARPDLDPDKTGKPGEPTLGILNIAREGKGIFPIADGSGGEIDKLTLL